MSEQITVALPRVSTAGSLRTMALRLAMRDTPMARVIVTTAGKPSGMALTARATAASNISNGELSQPSPTAKVIAATLRMTYSRVLLKRSNLRVRGVIRFVLSCISLEMRPVSVLSPVATTMPSPWPKVTKLPA